MDKQKQTIVRTIAMEIDCGFDCYFNVKTEEIITIPRHSFVADQDEVKEALVSELKCVENQKAHLIKFDALETSSIKKVFGVISRVSLHICSEAQWVAC